MIGGYRRWFSEEPPGKSSGRLRQKLLPACTSLTPSSTFSEVMRLIRPSSSSSPQSPQVEPSGRRSHRFATADLLTSLYRPVRTKLTGSRTVTPALSTRWLDPAQVQLDHDREAGAGGAAFAAGLLFCHRQRVELTAEVDERHLPVLADFLHPADQHQVVPAVDLRVGGTAQRDAGVLKER